MKLCQNKIPSIYFTRVSQTPSRSSGWPSGGSWQRARQCAVLLDIVAIPELLPGIITVLLPSDIPL